jgi:hypothetical protein
LLGAKHRDNSSGPQAILYTAQHTNAALNFTHAGKEATGVKQADANPEPESRLIAASFNG